MTFGLIARWKRWRAHKRGVHRAGAERQGTAAHPALSVELDAARKRLDHVERLAPMVDQLSVRIEARLSRNHLGPIVDQAFGLGPFKPRGGKA